MDSVCIKNRKFPVHGHGTKEKALPAGKQQKFFKGQPYL
jgi:hypothetical protein